MWFVPIYIVILGFTIVIDYVLGIVIERSESNKRKWLLYLSIIANLGVLCVFKYYNFFIDSYTNFAALLGFNYTPLPYLGILLPIGLSFHTFQAMSYTLEVYKGKQKAIKHFGIYALYVMFFPQLVAGPIEKPQALFPQFHFNYSFKWINISSGLRLILYGLFKKIAIADQLNVMVAYVFDKPEDAYGFSIYLAMVLFVFQVYCDFSGYSDIARGSAKLLGINLMENFNMPFFARTMSNFWARWHVSLMNWFRDYIMFPMIKKGHNWVYVFLLVFLLSGFWHGANFTFLAWGLYNGLVVVYAKATQKTRNSLINSFGISKNNTLRKTIQVFVVFNLFACGSVFFRAANISHSFELINGLFTNFLDSITQIIINTQNQRQKLLYLGQIPIVFYINMLLLSVFIIMEFKMRHENFEIFWSKFSIIHKYIFSLFLVFAIILLSNIQQTDFVYFQF